MPWSLILGGGEESVSGGLVQTQWSIVWAVRWSIVWGLDGPWSRGSVSGGQVVWAIQVGSGSPWLGDQVVHVWGEGGVELTNC